MTGNVKITKISFEELCGRSRVLKTFSAVLREESLQTGKLENKEESSHKENWVVLRTKFKMITRKYLCIVTFQYNVIDFHCE